MRMAGGAPGPITPAATATATASLRLCPPVCFLTSGIANVRIRAVPTSKQQQQQQQGVVVCSLLRPQNEAVLSQGDGGTTFSTTSRRREGILQMAFSALLMNIAPPALSLPITDAPAELRLYSDDVNKYQIFIPQDWQVGAGETDGIKSITAFYPEGATSNVSVLITGLGPDYTRLESFGKVDAFAENLVSGLDRSWQRPPGVTAKLIDCKASRGLYYIEYTLKNPGESRRHIYSVLGIANNGWYNRLYTVTGQFVDEEANKYSSQIEKAVQSFKLT